MKSILTSIAAASLVATMAVAQPYHGRGLQFKPEAPASNAPASRGNHLLVYVITVGLEFGAIDLRSGAFLPIGPGLPANVGDGLIPGPRRSLLSLGFDGSLVAIDPATGKTSVVGPTGLGDCSTPASPCGPNSALWIGYFDRGLDIATFTGTEESSVRHIEDDHIYCVNRILTDPRRNTVDVATANGFGNEWAVRRHSQRSTS